MLQTKEYFDRVAKRWANPPDDFSEYPTSEVRRDIVQNELWHINRKCSVIDLGCGAGQLVVNLLMTGYDAVGVDVSSNMIDEARKLAVDNLLQVNLMKTFQVADLLTYETDQKFNAVTALGVIEYLPNSNKFFDKVRKLLAPGGMAFIECRNRLFNLITANGYTLDEMADMRNLIHQLEEVAKYSPIKDAKEIGALVARARPAIEPRPVEATGNKPVVYPEDMVRKQHTPHQIDLMVARAGMKLKHVIYYHAHPFLPRYERLFPQIYNRAAYEMQPLGYTPLGASMCSAFVAVIEG